MNGNEQVGIESFPKYVPVFGRCLPAVVSQGGASVDSANAVEAAYVKAGFLSAIAMGETECKLIDRARAVKLLGNMHGGYNIETLVTLLGDRSPHARRSAAQALGWAPQRRRPVRVEAGGEQK